MSEKSAVPEVILIDLSSIAHPIWHTSQDDPDPNATSVRTVAKIRAIASGKEHVAICCDEGRSFRKDIDPDYKGNRPESLATLQHQITLAKETLRADGFPIWGVPTYEADDIIATAVKLANESEMDALIVSADKDLLQLVSEGDEGQRVRAMSPAKGEIVDADGVFAKFGVNPSQMRDFLALVGDASDNVKGAKGIGPKTAAELLKKHGSLGVLFASMDRDITRIGTPSIVTSLQDFRKRAETVCSLITLKTDAQIPFDEVKAPRVPKDAEEFDDFAEIEEGEIVDAPETAPPTAQDAERPVTATKCDGNHGAPPCADPRCWQGHAEPDPAAPTSLIRRPEITVETTWERQLDPRSMPEVRALATDLFKSRLFSAYGTPQGVLSTIMVGRELGLPAMASLRGIHIIEGKHALSAQLMVAIVLKSGFAEFFEPVSFDDKSATFVTKRHGARKEVSLTHTIEMAQVAELVKPKSNWLKIPTDMLVARAQSRLCRLVYPDLIGGLYTPDELEEIRNG